MQAIADLDDDKQLSLFETPVVKDMLDYKWMAYARKIHYLTASIHLIYVTVLITYVWKTYLIRHAYDPDQFIDLPPKIRYGMHKHELKRQLFDSF